MTFITEEEMGTAIYGYQVEEIADGNDTAMPFAISAAVEEVRSYLTPNDKKIYQDGRPLYDVKAVFSASGEQRNPMILQLVKTIAKYHFIELCNADILYERAKSNYDRAVSYLKDLAAGNVTLSQLPVINPDIPVTDPVTGLPVTDEPLPFRMGARKKFSHE